MKKALLYILALAMVIPMLVACANNDNSGKGTESDNQTTPAVTTPSTDPVEEVVIDTWVTEGYHKIVSNISKPSDAVNDISLYMAKNEMEGFHIAVRSSVDLTDLKVVLVDGARDDISIEMFEEYQIKTFRKYYPDPMVPIAESFSVTASENKPVLVRFKTTADTAAGNYSYKFNLVTSDGNVIDEYNVSLTVWDYALPEAFSTDSAVGLDSSYIVSKEKLPGRLKSKYYIAYYEMLLDYGLTASHLPYDILDEKADAYMSDPRVTCFQVPVSSDEKILEYYEKLKTNSVWLEKAYYYPFDEPTEVKHLDELAVICERLKTLTPDIKIVIPFFTNVKYDDDTDEIDFLDDYLGIWCPKSACWNENWLADPLGRGYFGDRMDEQKAQGDKIWWYVCWEPGPPYCNLYVDEVGLDHVKLFWQQYQNKSDGFLYWHSNYWKYTDDPWVDMATVKWLSTSVYGDGSLIYPGKNVDIEGPVASLRMECIRSGMEDIEMLKLAEELLGREWVDDQVYLVSQGLTKHNKKNDEFNAVRKTIGEAIEAALKND